MNEKQRQLAAIHGMEKELFREDHGDSREWDSNQRAAWHRLERRQEHEAKELRGGA